MPRLTADVIARSPAFLNALKDRELDLRGALINVASRRAPVDGLTNNLARLQDAVR